MLEFLRGRAHRLHQCFEQISTAFFFLSDYLFHA
jgi:hypothetical protein